MVRFKVSRRDLTAAAGRAILGHIAADESAGILAQTPVVLTEVFDEAIGLSRLYGERVGGRSYDLLHMTAARMLGLRDFLTFDMQQARLGCRCRAERSFLIGHFLKPRFSPDSD